MSTHIKKILVPVDFSATSDWAVKQAIDMAITLNAKLVFLHIVSPSSVKYPIKFDKFYRYELKIKEFIHEELRKLQNSIYFRKGIKPRIFVKTGSVSNGIVNFSKIRKVDLIIMGTHGASGIKEVFVGSNAMKVVSISRIPVLTIKKGRSITSLKNILIPFNDLMLNKTKLNIAIDVAKVFKAHVHLFGVYDNKIKHKQLETKLNEIVKLLDQENIVNTQNVVEGDNIAKKALRYLTYNKSDLVIINSGNESKSGSYFMGLIEEQIINHTSIPVISVKRVIK